MRISDWSSDVCSSDLREGFELTVGKPQVVTKKVDGKTYEPFEHLTIDAPEEYLGAITQLLATDRKSVVSGKSVSVRVDIGGRRIIKKKYTHITLASHKHNLEQSNTNTEGALAL